MSQYRVNTHPNLQDLGNSPTPTVDWPRLQDGIHHLQRHHVACHNPTHQNRTRPVGRCFSDAEEELRPMISGVPSNASVGGGSFGEKGIRIIREPTQRRDEFARQIHPTLSKCFTRGQTHPPGRSKHNSRIFIQRLKSGFVHGSMARNYWCRPPPKRQNAEAKTRNIPSISFNPPCVTIKHYGKKQTYQAPVVPLSHHH